MSTAVHRLKLPQLFAHMYGEKLVIKAARFLRRRAKQRIADQRGPCDTCRSRLDPFPEALHDWCLAEGYGFATECNLNRLFRNECESAIIEAAEELEKHQ